MGNEGIMSTLAKAFVESHCDVFSPSAVTSSTPTTTVLRGRQIEVEAEGEASRSEAISMDDTELAATYQFLEEIGFGNWGSVWKCRVKGDRDFDRRVAVKLVHRTKDAVSTARVRSLWSEYKCLRKLDSPHPNIIHFHSFTITPSYAIITMDLHTLSLIPVKLHEARARDYAVQIISGVRFLHDHGITHCDIKPSNIVLSARDEPILVDFGFSQTYDTTSGYRSSLSWGTPEYLSPERAGGLGHDERLSDIWALGVTIYEMVVGRTPFEETESEVFLTDAALEVYVKRTTTGRFYGSYNISPLFDNLVHRMLEPDPRRRLASCSDVSRHPFFRNQPTPTKSIQSSVNPIAESSPCRVPRGIVPSKSTSALEVYSDPSPKPPIPPRSAALSRRILTLSARRSSSKSSAVSSIDYGSVANGRSGSEDPQNVDGDDASVEERISLQDFIPTSSSTSPFRSSFSGARAGGSSSPLRSQSPRLTAPSSDSQPGLNSNWATNRSVSFDSSRFESQTKPVSSPIQEPILTPTRLRQFTAKVDRDFRTSPSFSRDVYHPGLRARPSAGALSRQRVSSFTSPKRLPTESRRGALKDVQWTVAAGLSTNPPVLPTRQYAQDENDRSIVDRSPPLLQHSNRSQSSLRWNPDEFDSSSESSDDGAHDLTDDDPTIIIPRPIPPLPLQPFKTSHSSITTTLSTTSRSHLQTILPHVFQSKSSTSSMRRKKVEKESSGSVATGDSTGSKSGRGIKWMRALGIARGV